MTVTKSESNLTKIKPGHHAYGLIGAETDWEGLVPHIEKEFAVSVPGNPDFFQGSYQNFTIDDARELKSIHETRPTVSKGKKIFVLTMDGITVEAQNALLKLLEEPAEYAIFFLVIRSLDLLLPTVRSRLSLVGSGGRRKSDESTEAEQFLRSSAAERIEIIKALVADIAQEKRSRSDASSFLDDIELALYRSKGVRKGKHELETIETARKYMKDRSPSIKILLEYVALNI